MSYNSTLIAYAIRLLEAPVNAELRKAVIEVARNYDSSRTFNELYQILNTAQTNVGGEKIDGKKMALYISELCGLDSNVMLPFISEVGKHLLIAEELKAMIN